MLRNIDINEISDGHRYSCNDMVKIGCNDCEGCSSCCEHMEGLISLDPYDINRMARRIPQSVMLEPDMLAGDSDRRNVSFESLLNKNIELTVDRGLLVPVLKMNENTGKCTFLRKDGRCGIHDARSGVCRLFPMGRLYEDGTFYYFLQKDECPYPGKTKVKLKKWLETEEIGKYEKYICDWHYFVRDIQEYISNASEEETRQINMVLLQIFFITPYKDDFYQDFYERLNKVKGLLK